MPVYGTRPEAIKMAPVIEAMARSSRLRAVVTVTGQHREMLDQVNGLFGIVPEHDLDIITPRQSLVDVTARTLHRLTVVLQQVRPDVVVVQGDTTTSMAAALAAFYEMVPVVHVEAGLRTDDVRSPFPEEMNRRLTTRLAALHLAPTATSRANLLAEGIRETDVVVTGNTVIDALLATVDRPVRFDDERLKALVDDPRRLVLVTTHRRESWGAAMAGIGRALARLAAAETGTVFVLPLHRNPVVREVLLPVLEGIDNVIVTEPLEYGQFAHLIARSHLVLTDSGGVQEEAPSLGKPVLVMRDNTERPEAVAAGTVRLVGTDEETVVAEVTRLLHDDAHHASMAHAVNPYGDGMAGPRSVAAIEALLGLGERLPDFTGDLTCDTVCTADEVPR
jgi:UDP-N-acetylglucosamine 2-epimerase (non-hydrolysing)